MKALFNNNLFITTVILGYFLIAASLTVYFNTIMYLGLSIIIAFVFVGVYSALTDEDLK
jgi:hypothetical protein